MYVGDAIVLGLFLFDLVFIGSCCIVLDRAKFNSPALVRHRFHFRKRSVRGVFSTYCKAELSVVLVIVAIINSSIITIYRKCLCCLNIQFSRNNIFFYICKAYFNRQSGSRIRESCYNDRLVVFSAAAITNLCAITVRNHNTAVICRSNKLLYIYLEFISISRHICGVNIIGYLPNGKLCSALHKKSAGVCLVIYTRICVT